MLNEAIEKAINLACSVELRDFTDKEKQYIVNCTNGSDGGNPSFWEDLMFWFESTLSDGCWSKANEAFMNSLKEEK